VEDHPELERELRNGAAGRRADADDERRREKREERSTDSPAPRRPPDPGDGVVRVAREKSGRKGKTVTVVRGVPTSALAEAASDLKRHCGAGGTVKDGTIELQGDHRDKAAARLRARGYEVKLAGG
jgi:translation initiation factor 1